MWNAMKNERICESQVVFPWRRFWARSLDLSLYSLVWSAVLGAGFHINMANRGLGWNIFDSVIGIVLMILVEPLLLKLFGTTPGKWIFGLRLKGQDGKHPDYRAGLDRVMGVVCYGEGFFIPGYQIYRLWKSYGTCKTGERLSWDGDLLYTIKDRKGYRYLFFAAAEIGIMAAIILVVGIAQIPVNRGSLTVQQFAENYNKKAAYYKIADGRYLDETGTWAQENYDSTFYIDLYADKRPEFTYTVVDGKLTGINFEIEMAGDQGWLSGGKNQVILAVLSFVGAREEAGLFFDNTSGIPKLIANHIFEDYDFTSCGVKVGWEVDYSGYELVENEMLVPENGKEPYYHIVFSMSQIEE